MRSCLAALACAVALCLGCYETKFTLSDPASAKVDRALIGDYESQSAEVSVVAGGDDKGAKATVTPTKDKDHLTVRNVDGKQYYVEMFQIPEKGVTDKSPTRMIAFTTDVKGVTFVHLRELTDDGQVPEKHLIMRVALSPDKNTLTLRNLSEDFFKPQTIESDEQLRKVVAEHINDDAMYDKETVTMTRVAVKK